MNLGIIGLGRMGGNMARRWCKAGVSLIAYNRHFETSQALAEECGLEAAESLEQLVSSLTAPRVLWLMLPAGEVTASYIQQLIPLLSKGDIIVDGANSFYKDSINRAEILQKRGIHFVDVGVSGGIWGLKNGYTLMAGGEAGAVQEIEPYLKTLAPSAEQGWMHCGPVGSGHYVKMIHNGIEYGMMQAFAEGFALLKGHESFDIKLAEVAETWRHGSVVRSWLLDLCADFLENDEELDDIQAYVADSGEGRWTALEAIEQGMPAPVITMGLMMRYASQGKNDYPAKLLSMMRFGFGGHAFKTDKGE
ncbi:MAG: decarboxylating 6-phosphogluconate dehydrogenase [Proteobacteria bacterium]|nr:decarboxylating 6-phosphogluconate dehydrogenase [Pseudomonadota bacterium]